MKIYIKNLFYKAGLSPVLDSILYRYSFLKNKKHNQAYAKKNSLVAYPPDYYLYETYKLDYQQYIEDGDLSAKEIVEWTMKHINIQKLNILEWGCGVSRTTRHLHKYLPQHSNIFACDVNAGMIEWNKAHIQNIHFSLINHNPPTSYNTSCFNIIFCISVFTHIDSIQQTNWLKEIYRILDDSGIFLFTTHGSYYNNKLLQKELQELTEKGVYTKNYYKRGHRLMSTYNDANQFKKVVENLFTVLEFYDGSSNLEKVGGQDLWIVQKKQSTES